MAAAMTTETADVSSSTEDSMDLDPRNGDDEFREDGDIMGDGGITKNIIKIGEGWLRPETGDEVTMHYKGYLEDGSVFDSSYDEGRSPMKFKVGEGAVIKGWDVVAKTMAKGEKAKVTLTPAYGYGDAGAPPKIPPGAKLIFEMELLGWQSKKDLYGDGGVIKTEIKVGNGWERPRRPAEVTIDLRVFSVASDGTRTELHKGRRIFSLGRSEVPAPLEKAVKDMKSNSKIELKCTGKYVGGPTMDFIPAGTETIIYDVTLLSWLKVEDLTGDEGVMKKITSEGEGWERPNEGAQIVVDLSYSVYDPETHQPREEFEALDSYRCTLGDGDLIDGLEKALTSMKKREEAVVVIKPNYAYESAPDLMPSGRGVTEKDTVVVAAKVIAFKKAKDLWSLSFEDKAKKMRERKEKGNELFKKKRLHVALKNYERAVSFFDSSTSELSAELKKEVNHLLVQCHLNIAICHDKENRHAKVLQHCNKALEIEPSNVKALYRRGTAYLKLEDYYKAKSDLKYALELSDGATKFSIRQKLKELTVKQAKQDAVDKKLYSNLFGRLSKMEERERLQQQRMASEGDVPVEKRGTETKVSA